MTDLNPLDIVLVLLAIGYGIAGFRQGFLIGAFGVVGLVAGGLVAVWIGPMILMQFEPSMAVSLGAVIAVILLALLGQTLGSIVGEQLRSKITWRPAHAVDAGGGVVLSIAALFVVAWILGSAVAGSQLGEMSKLVRKSTILGAVDQVMPADAQKAFLSFSQVVDPSLFPRFLEPFAPEQISPAAPPDSGVLKDPDVARAADSVVKVNGTALQCGRSLAGSGFVYDRNRVLTNAHVVAGVRSPTIRSRAGKTYDAEVVLYDPGRDVAVLAVPDLDLRPLPLDQSAKTGDGGAVLGYPGNGPFTAGAARIRSEQDLRGPDIYGSRQVVREVFALYAQVRPGNSGGPLVSPSGAVTGLLFAASVEDSSTGYALTIDEIERTAAAGRAASRPVSTGACA